MRTYRIGMAMVLAASAAGIVPRALGADAPDLKARADAAMDKAVGWLKTQQNPAGYYGPQENVAFTALVLGALAMKGQKEADGDFVAKTSAYLVSKQVKEGDDKGAIMIPEQDLANYNTCNSVMALAALDREKYKDVLAAAEAYLRKIQDKDDVPSQGGTRYGTDDLKKADLSNTAFWVEAMRAAGAAADDEALKRAMIFVSRCQNRAENDMGKFGWKTEDGKTVKTGTDGGFYYAFDESKAGFDVNPDGTVTPKSYGSMTVSGLKALIYAGVAKDDPRVQACVGWVKAHWTLDENPGLRTEGKPASEMQGLYYYYRVFARAFDAYGEATIETTDGKKHRWAEEYCEKLLSLQKADGSWVNEHASRWEEGNPLLATAFALQGLATAKGWLGKE